VADVWTEHGEATKVLVASFCTCIIAASGFVCTMCGFFFLCAYVAPLSLDLPSICVHASKASIGSLI
jgi:hypothetical protein